MSFCCAQHLPQHQQALSGPSALVAGRLEHLLASSAHARSLLSAQPHLVGQQLLQPLKTWCSGAKPGSLAPAHGNCCRVLSAVLEGSGGSFGLPTAEEEERAAADAMDFCCSALDKHQVLKLSVFTCGEADRS